MKFDIPRRKMQQEGAFSYQTAEEYTNIIQQFKRNSKHHSKSHQTRSPRSSHSPRQKHSPQSIQSSRYIQTNSPRQTHLILPVQTDLLSPQTYLLSRQKQNLIRYKHSESSQTHHQSFKTFMPSSVVKHQQNNHCLKFSGTVKSSHRKRFQTLQLNSNDEHTVSLSKKRLCQRTNTISLRHLRMRNKLGLRSTSCSNYSSIKQQKNDIHNNHAHQDLRLQNFSSRCQKNVYRLVNRRERCTTYQQQHLLGLLQRESSDLRCGIQGVHASIGQTRRLIEQQRAKHRAQTQMYNIQVEKLRKTLGMQQTARQCTLTINLNQEQPNTSDFNLQGTFKLEV